MTATGNPSEAAPSRRDPRQEAAALLPPGYGARVLEPSPPADRDPTWFADDPTDPAEGGAIVTPIPGEGTGWAEMADRDSAVARFAAEHWLDGRRRLTALPTSFDTTRRALHQVAFFAVAPVRHRAVGKLGLRSTHGGFGTPFFPGPGGSSQVRVEGDRLVYQTEGRVRGRRLTTLDDATRFLEVPFRAAWFDGFVDPPAPVDPHSVLDVDPAAATALADWFGFATHVLERLRRTPGAGEVSRVQLWPEHFDMAIEMGPAGDGGRAAYGASPGDAGHPEPYLYVAPWGAVDRSDPYWNDRSFNGASLAYRRLLECEDPYRAALAFLAEGHRRVGR
jgi:hypothetical protein